VQSSKGILPNKSVVDNVNLPYVLVSERPSPFIRAEKIKREYAARLDALLTEYESEIAASLAGEDFSEAYRLAETDAYLARLGQILRAHERQTSERAAHAERLERGSAWVKQTAEPKEHPNDI
jgi:hypothetical protein